MKRMKGKIFAALLVCLTVGLLAAPALARPKWVGVSGRWTIVRNEKQKDKDAKDYKQACCEVTYTNKSKDKIITAIFNKTISMSSRLSGIHFGSAGKDVTANGKFTDVTKVELYPGQSVSRKYTMNIEMTTSGGRWLFNQYGGELTNLKWNHDFNVTTQTISVE